jgi:hypothetical protein
MKGMWKKGRRYISEGIKKGRKRVKVKDMN